MGDCLFYNGIFSTTKHTAQDYNNVVRSPLKGTIPWDELG